MTTVVVRGVPAWVDAARLLGPGPWRADGGAWRAELAPAAAADLGARLRGVVLGGSPLAVESRPPLGRPLVREARLQDARRRRHTSPGFRRPGARLDDEGRWSLTPEDLALALGRAAGGVTVLDACCGCGGNAIGFARAGSRVVAVEPDAGRLALARHNAALYGVADRITFVRGRAEDHAAAAGADLWFVDPPWGGPDAAATALSALEPAAALLAGPHPPVWLKVPPAFDPAGLGEPAAWFGEGEGDRRRVKFLLVAVPAVTS